ncbi:hypothetical protein DL766_002301 [Monosporascus sp. MC13-8B]|uniref:Thioester reductase (TE) domain-containing protein n=1 Tax=Monosporascus cannonballus TaxID=155416 RepID=A0ABY0HF03_9PEZI|nr:hypothetical protein DL763_010761 [Monosporascus cannonballus]RYO91948.1 hypothetical protein DL762_001886 [Monosporascus cannonballus]RYP35834.1 hypothetical protein DL766_002301 [Monosporascus sp. MC13-8B]
MIASTRTRAIHKGVSPATSPVALVKENGPFVLEEATFAHDYDSSDGNMKVKVESSSAFCILHVGWPSILYLRREDPWASSLPHYILTEIRWKGPIHTSAINRARVQALNTSRYSKIRAHGSWEKAAPDSLLESSAGGGVDIVYVARGLYEKAYLLSYGSAKLHKLLAQYLSTLDSACAARYQGSQGSISVDTISQYPDQQRLSHSTVVDWETSESLSVRVRPVDVQGFFSGEKTHFFVGLTRDVGFSLCEWMIDHGARHFALASRNPKIDAAIMRHLQNKGGT